MVRIYDIPLAIGTALELRPQKLGLTSSFTFDRKLFADNSQLSQIDSPDWQIIYGRRGAGKTTLLATYAKYITETIPLDAASIEVSVPDFISIVQNAIPEIVTDAEKAQIYFSSFMRFVAGHLFDVFSNANSKSKFYQKYAISRKQKAIQDIITRIHDSTSEASPTEVGAKRSVKKNRNRTVQRVRDYAIRARGKLGFGSTGLNVDSDISADGGQSRKDTDENQLIDNVELKNYKFDYAQTRRLVEELLELLEIRKLYIFLDEWSDLDRSCKTKIQPLFAELIRRVFWKNDKFVFKIGSIRNQTILNASFENDGLLGLELGADIFDIDLDRIYSDKRVNKIVFFSELLYRHLSYCNPDLLELRDRGSHLLYGVEYVKPGPHFIEFIFKDHRVFAELIKGSGTLPRDFIDILDSISRSKHHQVVPTWTMEDVRSGIISHFTNKKQPGILGNGELNSLFDDIIRKVRTNETRLVAFSRNADGRKIELMAELYHRRFLHDVSPQDIPLLLRNRYFFFYGDLGLHLDVHRGQNSEWFDRDACPLRDDDDEHSIGSYVIF